MEKETEYVSGIKVDEDFGVMIDGIIAFKVPAIVDQKWPTLKNALLDAAREWRGKKPPLTPS